MTRMHGSECSGNPCIRGLIRVRLVQCDMARSDPNADVRRGVQRFLREPWAQS
jgi:hypothetical protein